MAAPTYATDLTDLSTAEASTNWAEPTAVGWTFGAAVGTADSENAIQGTNAVPKAFNATGVGGLMYNNAAGVTIPTAGAYYQWFFWASPAALDTDTNGGVRLMVGNSLAAFYGSKQRGKDTYPFGGWLCLVFDPNETGARDYTAGAPSGTWQYFGAAVNNTNAITKGSPFVIDAARYGRGELRCTNGDVTNGYASFGGSSPDAGSAAYDTDSTRRWGILTPKDGAYYLQGLYIMGLAGTSVDFRDSNRAIFINDTKKVASAFNGFEIRHASSRVDWTNISILALGTQSRGTFTVTDNADVNLLTCTFTDMGAFSFLAATDALDCTFRRTDTITAPGSNLSGSTVAESRVAADAGAVVWNVTTDTDGKLNNMTFSKGTNAHHAITFGASADNVSNTLRGITFTGFHASNGNNDSALYFADKGSDVTWTVNLIGCSGNISYKKARAGDTVVLNVDPVTLAVHVQDINTAAAIATARVWVPVTSGASGRAYDHTVTITNSGTTATVTHTVDHGLATGQYIYISGASLAANNGTYSVTVTTTKIYTYTMLSTPGSNPTGTIKATWVIINKDTNGSGDASESYSYLADQPFSGRVRRATVALGTLYKTSPVVGTVDSVNGLSVTIQMIPDA